MEEPLDDPLAEASRIDAKVADLDARMRQLYGEGGLDEKDVANIETSLRLMQRRAERYREIAKMQKGRALKIAFANAGGFNDKPEFWPKEYRQQPSK